MVHMNRLFAGFGRLLLAAALLAPAPLLSGCVSAGTGAGALGTVLTDANKPLDQVTNTLVDERAYYALLSGEKYLNQIASDAVDLGLKPGSPTAVSLADALKLYASVSTAAQKAKALNDAATVAQKVSAGKDLYQQILGLVSKGISQGR